LKISCLKDTKLDSRSAMLFFMVVSIFHSKGLKDLKEEGGLRCNDTYSCYPK
jgi:hypothetical protein